MVTPFLSQIALSFGCDDVEGTVVYERIYHEAGAHTDMHMPYLELVRLIRGAGQAPGRARQPLPVRARAVRRAAARAIAPAGRRHCPWCTPHEARAASPGSTAIRSTEPSTAAWSTCRPSSCTGTASELNDLLAAGELEVSVVSAVEYARNAAAYHLLPDLAITCDGPVHSVALFSRRPGRGADGADRPRDRLVAHVGPAARPALPPPLGGRARASPPPAPKRPTCSLAGLPHEARARHRRCGAHARGRSGAIPYASTSAPSGRTWTGLPFVFAVWAARREAGCRRCSAVHARLLESRAWGLAHLDELAGRRGACAPASREAVCRAYLGDLDYALSYRHLAGLTDFFRRLAQDGLGAGRLAVVHPGCVETLMRWS